MNLLDVLILSTILYLLVRGILRGFIREITSLLGVILGIWLANRFHPGVSEYLKTYIPFAAFLPLISFGAIFVSVVIAFNFLGNLFSYLVKKSFQGGIDRMLGAGLALIKSVVLTYLVIVLLTFFLPAQTPLIAKSKLAPIIVVSYRSMVQLISPQFYKKWEHYFQKWEMNGTGSSVPRVKNKTKPESP